VAGASGEFDLIRRLAGVLGPASGGVRVGIGDDAAVLAGGVVATIDLVVEDVHFRRSTSPLEDVGWKALAVNISDLAAMAADPVCALVGLGLPEGLADADAEELYRGLHDCADTYRCPVAGGDISRAASLTLAVAVIGQAPAPVLRAGAVPGDVLVVTGELGGSEAGRILLERGDAPPSLAERHLRPRPRLAESRRLAGVAHAMLDVSDGVASDAARLAEASEVRVVVDLDRLPLQAGVAGVAASRGVEPGAFAATGGEDYELLAAVPAEAVAGLPVTVIGRIEAGSGVGFEGAGAGDSLRGWDHLA
jgi:thiamine-monophosphate kinase